MRSGVGGILTSPSCLVEGVRSGSWRRNAATASSLVRGVLGRNRGVKHPYGEGCALPPVCGVCWCTPRMAARATTEYCHALHGLPPACMPKGAIYVSPTRRGKRTRRGAQRWGLPPGTGAIAEQVPQVSQAYPSCCPMLVTSSSTPHNCPARGQLFQPPGHCFPIVSEPWTQHSVRVTSAGGHAQGCILQPVLALKKRSDMRSLLNYSSEDENTDDTTYS